MKIDTEVIVEKDKMSKNNNFNNKRKKPRKIKTEHLIFDEDQINILAKLKRQLQENEKKLNGNEKDKK